MRIIINNSLLCGYFNFFRNWPIFAYLSILLLTGCQHNRTLDSKKAKFDVVLQHFKDDTLKLKSATFLIDNIDEHYSLAMKCANRYGVDVGDFVNTYCGKLPVPALLDSVGAKISTDTIWDIDQVTPEYLIDNVNEAVTSLRLNKHSSTISFHDFSENILPYRIHHEPLDNWRPYLRERYSNYLRKIGADTIDIYHKIQRINVEILGWQRQGAKYAFKVPSHHNVSQTLRYKSWWGCTEISPFRIFVYRSLGIPACSEIIDMFGTMNAGHEDSGVMYETGTYNSAITDTNHFKYLIAKMYRQTYSRQPSAYDNMILIGEDPSNIPPNFTVRNRVDITKERTKVSNPKFFLDQPAGIKTLFICTFFKGKWVPVEWAPYDSTEKSIEFKQMGRNIVYQIASYRKGRYTLIGHPFLLDTVGNIIQLTSTSKHTIDMQLNSYGRYAQNLVPGLKYYIFLWNSELSGWRLLSEPHADWQGLIKLKNVPVDGLWGLSTKNDGAVPPWRFFTYEQNQQRWR